MWQQMTRAGWMDQWVLEGNVLFCGHNNTVAAKGTYLVFSVINSHHVKSFESFVTYLHSRVGMALP